MVMVVGNADQSLTSTTLFWDVAIIRIYGFSPNFTTGIDQVSSDFQTFELPE